MRSAMLSLLSRCILLSPGCRGQNRNKQSLRGETLLLTTSGQRRGSKTTLTTHTRTQTQAQTHTLCYFLSRSLAVMDGALSFLEG
ncbi:hypothetical protein SODALDRAFT_75890 [Sodiomyces alkalinus F11]|uniref:Secreted protein n=1 Tax=Sodiomyces alkalinus (strain CBS 110278 / VKM F-3762 / F11) TaxID=1314773 RepID=A0A3N2PKG2_SODAK|nr:hypothetical protein SODALDRAFT_75890 [Sodiomyces alkalinus F11]ROT34995.1 hypothetical protein SODALDRAFT_75890 [Sodiomyces alkalinus F11]